MFYSRGATALHLSSSVKRYWRLDATVSWKMSKTCNLIVTYLYTTGSAIAAPFGTMIMIMVGIVPSLNSSISSVRQIGLAERRYVPCIVGGHASEDDDIPENQLRPHPPFPVFEAQPLRENVGTCNDGYV